MAPQHHKTARGILARRGSIVVMKGNDETFCHLPGGHIDRGEEAIEALAREVREELALTLSFIRWVAKIENDWPGTNIHESMDLYEIQTWPSTAPLAAQESHLTAFWYPWHKVAEIDLRPPLAWPWIARIGGQS